MCSNSMVRFNNKGKFNQGYRGNSCGDFFNDKTISSCVKDLNKIRSLTSNMTFFILPFQEVFSGILKSTVDKGLIILDPPYVIEDGCYSGQYTLKEEKILY